LDADQIHRKSTIPVPLEIFSIQLGEGQKLDADSPGGLDAVLDPNVNVILGRHASAIQRAGDKPEVRMGEASSCTQGMLPLFGIEVRS
jgi:hypothetical protein